MMQGNIAYNFGEISSMQDLFADVKKRRRGRQPQYVLVVEDDPLTRRIVSYSFKENYALVTAQSAHDAVANYLLYAPDIVFLDIGLPDVDGFAVLKQILHCDPDAYVVMFSSHSSSDTVAKALYEGAMGFVGKPFKSQDMRQYIESSSDHHHKRGM
jgi:DNA-binding NtrC family response regulator